MRLGNFSPAGRCQIAAGDEFRLDLDDKPGDKKRAPLPHLEVFAALEPGNELLVDDGKVRLKVRRSAARITL